MSKKRFTDDRKQLLIRYKIDEKGCVSFIDPCCDEIPICLFGKIMEAISNVEQEWNCRIANKVDSLLPNITFDKPNVLHHPELIKYEAGYNFSVCRYTVDCFAGTHIENSPFDSCVSMIKWLIAKGYFSKEYLSNTD